MTIDKAHYVVVDDQTGLIATAGFTDPDRLEFVNVPTGHTLRELNEDAPLDHATRKSLMWDETLQPRPVLNVTPDKTQVEADGIEKVTVPNVPNGTKVRRLALGEPVHE